MQNGWNDANLLINRSLKNASCFKICQFSLRFCALCHFTEESYKVDVKNNFNFFFQKMSHLLNEKYRKNPEKY